MKSDARRLATARIIAMALTLGGCARAPDPRDTEVNLRVRSPDGKLDAIYAEDVGGGPAVGVTEEIFVAKPGVFPDMKGRVFSEECVHNIALTWETPRRLRISYDIGSDVREDPRLHKPSVFSVFSSAYWTFGNPHGTEIHFIRRLMPPQVGC